MSAGLLVYSVYPDLLHGSCRSLTLRLRRIDQRNTQVASTRPSPTRRLRATALHNLLLDVANHGFGTNPANRIDGPNINSGSGEVRSARSDRDAIFRETLPGTASIAPDTEGNGSSRPALSGRPKTSRRRSEFPAPSRKHPLKRGSTPLGTKRLPPTPMPAADETREPTREVHRS